VRLYCLPSRKSVKEGVRGILLPKKKAAHSRRVTARGKGSERRPSPGVEIPAKSEFKGDVFREVTTGKEGGARLYSRVQTGKRKRGKK